jgi:hypothetical protein
MVKLIMEILLIICSAFCYEFKKDSLTVEGILKEIKSTKTFSEVCKIENNRISELNLSWEDIHIIPDTIGSLSSLQNLKLNNNNIEYLPASIGRLTSLMELTLDNNYLKSIPETIGALGPSLKNLDLYGNLLHELPLSITRLSSKIKISGNRICSTIQDEIFNWLETHAEESWALNQVCSLKNMNNPMDIIHFPGGAPTRTTIKDTSGCSVTILRNDQNIKIRKSLIDYIVFVKEKNFKLVKNDTVFYKNYHCMEKTEVKAINSPETEELKCLKKLSEYQPNNSGLKDGSKIAFHVDPLRGKESLNLFEALSGKVIYLVGKKWQIETVDTKTLCACLMSDSCEFDALFTPVRYSCSPANLRNDTSRNSNIGFLGQSPSMPPKMASLPYRKETSHDLLSSVEFALFDLKNKTLLFHEKTNRLNPVVKRVGNTGYENNDEIDLQNQDDETEKNNFDSLEKELLDKLASYLKITNR